MIVHMHIGNLLIIKPLTFIATNYRKQGDNCREKRWKKSTK